MSAINKQLLLDKISDDKKANIEPLIDQILWFYGPNLEMHPTSDTLSRFVRDIKFIKDDQPPVPFGRIYISDQGFPEEALVHELLHLAMPLRHGVYGIGFDRDDEALKEYTALINNVIEHDLFKDDFLNFGYALDRFLSDSSSLNMNYQKRMKEGGTDKVYWTHEYLRLSITMQHLPESRKAVCRKGIENARKISLTLYPELQASFQEIRQWINEKSFHTQGQYFQSVTQLFKIMRIPLPVKFLSPAGEQAIRVIYAKQLK